MPAYLVIRAEITDPAGFRAYVVAVSKLVSEMGGSYIIQGGGISECLEGNWPDTQKLVISQWSSMAAARAFWQCPAYQEIKQLRAGKAHVHVRLYEGSA